MNDRQTNQTITVHTNNMDMKHLFFYLHTPGEAIDQKCLYDFLFFIFFIFHLFHFSFFSFLKTYQDFFGVEVICYYQKFIHDSCNSLNILLLLNVPSVSQCQVLVIQVIVFFVLYFALSLTPLSLFFFLAPNFFLSFFLLTFLIFLDFRLNSLFS